MRLTSLVLIAAALTAGVSSQDVTLNKSTSKFDMSFSNEEVLSTSEVFAFESVSAEYFHQLLAASQVIEREILTTDVNVEDQTSGDEVFTSSGGNLGTKLKSSVIVTYAGEDSISDLASVLSMVVREDQGVELLDLLIKDGIITEGTSAKVLFSTPKDPNQADSSVTITAELGPSKQLQSGKTPVVVVCIGLALCLLGVSLVFFYVVGGFKECSYGSRNLSYAARAVDEDSRDYDGSGRLGAKPSTEEDEENVPPPTITMVDSRKRGLTPRKGFYQEDEETSRVLTPLSLADESNHSNNADQSVASSRAPLGIRSMSKLKRTRTPQKDQHTVAIQFSKIVD